MFDSSFFYVEIYPRGYIEKIKKNTKNNEFRGLIAIFYVSDFETKYAGIEFDFEAFEEWLATVDKPCIISSYEAPRGCVEIASKETRVIFSPGKNSKVAKKLFIQSRYKDWYKEEMKKVRGQLL